MSTILKSLPKGENVGIAFSGGLDTSAAAATSVKKCPPNAIRKPLVTTPNRVAAVKASGRHAGGVSAAGA